MVELAGHLEALLYCMLEVAIRIEIGGLQTRRGINAMSQIGQRQTFRPNSLSAAIAPKALERTASFHPAITKITFSFEDVN